MGLSLSQRLVRVTGGCTMSTVAKTKDRWGEGGF